MTLSLSLSSHPLNSHLPFAAFGCNHGIFLTPNFPLTSHLTGAGAHWPRCCTNTDQKDIPYSKRGNFFLHHHFHVTQLRYCLDSTSRPSSPLTGSSASFKCQPSKPKHVQQNALLLICTNKHDHVIPSSNKSIGSPIILGHNSVNLCYKVFCGVAPTSAHSLITPASSLNFTIVGEGFFPLQIQLPGTTFLYTLGTALRFGM